MMLSKLLIAMILLQMTSFSKSTCEDDKSFIDSYGWSCKDYKRAPQECKLSKKYEKDGKSALASCCICRNAWKKPDISNDFKMSFLEQFDERRRQSQQCLQGCYTVSEDCSDDCETTEASCQSKCTDVLSTCNELCVITNEEEEEEEEEEEDEAGGVVDDDETADESSNAMLEWYYILIIGLALLALVCFCLLLMWYLRNRVKTAVLRPTTQEQAPMVGNAQYVPGVGEYYRPEPPLPYDQQYAGGCTGGPVYS